MNGNRHKKHIKDYSIELSNDIISCTYEAYLELSLSLKTKLYENYKREVKELSEKVKKYENRWTKETHPLRDVFKVLDFTIPNVNDSNTKMVLEMQINMIKAFTGFKELTQTPNTDKGEVKSG